MSAFLLTLLALSAKATLVVVVVLAVQRLFAGWMPAGFRHALWLLVALRLVVPSLPESPTSLFIAAHPHTTLPGLIEWLPEPVPSTAASVPGTGTSSAISDSPVASLLTGTPLTAVLLVLWLGGLAIVASRMFGAHRELQTLLRNATLVESGPTRILLDRVRDEIGLRRRVRLLASPLIDGPAACGILRPTVLVPTDFASRRSQAQQRHALLHELAHLKRHDALWLHLAHLAVAIHWFNPFLWLARRRFHADLESACDATVLNHLERPERVNYGRTVLAFGVRPSLAAQSLGFAVDSSRQLTQRIHMITKFSSPSRRRSVLLFAMAAVLVALTLTDLPSAFANPGGDEETIQLLAQSIVYQLSQMGDNPRVQAQKVANLIEESTLPNAVVMNALNREADRLERSGDASKMPVRLRHLADVIAREAGGPEPTTPQTLETVQTLRQAGTMLYRGILEVSLGENPSREATMVSPAFRWQDCPKVEHAWLQETLGAETELPSHDAWGQELDFCMKIDPKKPIGWIGVRSSGSDGLFDETYQVGAFEAARSESDIVWFSGYFMRWPLS